MAAARLSDTTFINDANLISYWPLNGDFEDKKSGYHLTAVGSPTQRTDAFGVANGAYAFDGSSQYAYVLNASCANLEIIDNSFTYLAWIYVDSLPGAYMSPIAKSKDDGNRTHLNIANDASHVMIFASKGVTETYSTSTAPSTGAWFLLVGVYDKAAGYKYVYFGKTKFSTSVTGTLAGTAADFSIAVQRYASPVNFFDGAMCDVAVFNRALTETEIGQIVDGTSRLVTTNYLKKYRRLSFQ